MKKLTCALLVLSISSLVGWAQTLASYHTTVTNQSPNYYFTFDGGSLASSGTNATVVTWTTVPDVFTQFGIDVFGNSGSSAVFATKNDLLVDPNESTDMVINSGGGGVATTNSTATGSISFLFQSLDPGVYTAQKYIFDAGHVSGDHNMCALLFQNTNTSLGSATNALVLRFGNNDTTLLPFTNVVPSAWYYFALTYTEATNGAFLDSSGTNLVVVKGKWYLGAQGGTLASGLTTNALDAVAGQGALYLGNSTATTAGFASPGSGFLDEFATWSRRLSDAEVQAQFANVPVPAPVVLVTNVIVDDSFADGSRTNTGPLQADWWSSSSTNGNSVEAYTNELGLISGTSGRGLHGTFAPQTLAVGDTIRATFTFTTPATVGPSATVSSALKIALMDLNNPGLAADQTSSSTFTNVLYTNLPGYDADYDVNDAVASDINIRKHTTPNTTGRFLGTTAEWVSLANSPDVGYTFAANTEYHGVLSITRTDTDSVDIFSSMSHGATLMDSFTGSDASGIANHFGMLGFWVNSSIFGSTTTPGQGVDNGITFSNIKVEVVTVSTAPPTLTIATSGGQAIISWPSTFTGYALQSTTNLASPTWVNAGTASTVGSNFVVTNALNSNAKFYQLKK